MGVGPDRGPGPGPGTCNFGRTRPGPGPSIEKNIELDPGPAPVLQNLPEPGPGPVKKICLPGGETGVVKTNTEATAQVKNA